MFCNKIIILEEAMFVTFNNNILCNILTPGHPFYLHEFLEDSSLYLPEVVKPPRVSNTMNTQWIAINTGLRRAAVTCLKLKLNCSFEVKQWLFPLTSEPGASGTS